MAKDKCPCAGCTFRHIGCHASCRNYTAWKQAREALAEIIRKEKLKDRYY